MTTTNWATNFEVKKDLKSKSLKSNYFLDEAFGFIDKCGANLFISAKPSPAFSVKVKVKTLDCFASLAMTVIARSEATKQSRKSKDLQQRGI